MKKWITACLALALLVVGTLGCAEGSWSQINQELARGADWQRFAGESPYHLGEAVPLGDTGVSILGWGNYPSIDGSTVCVPMAMELARQLLDLPEEDLNGFVTFSTTHYAYERLIGGKANPSVTVLSRMAMMDDTHPVDLLLGTAPSAEEAAMAEDAGVKLVLVPVCYDAFVFMVNAENNVTGLTTGQIRGIYSGMIRTWDEVGGSPAPIQAYQRPANSGSQTAMEELVMAGTDLVAEQNFISDGMADIVAQIGNYDNGCNAIGYSYLYYLDALYREGSLRVLEVDGVAPTPENLISGAYPYAVRYYAVYREGDEATAAFVDWMTSKPGRQALAQAGYVVE